MNDRPTGVSLAGLERFIRRRWVKLKGGGSMPFNKFTVIISALVLAGLFYYTGYWTAARMGREKCIATVTENCLKICGVGAEFCYPDDEDPVDSDAAFEEDEGVLACFQRGDL